MMSECCRVACVEPDIGSRALAASTRAASVRAHSARMDTQKQHQPPQGQVDVGSCSRRCLQWQHRRGLGAPAPALWP